jgi:hypothetical protein
MSSGSSTRRGRTCIGDAGSWRGNDDQRQFYVIDGNVFLVAILAGSAISHALSGRCLGTFLNRPGIVIELANSLAFTVGGVKLTKDGRKISRRARVRCPHEAERLSKRIAALDRILSALRAERLQIAGRNKRLKIGLARVSLCVRRPIASRYQTPTESGNRRASSRS